MRERGCYLEGYRLEKPWPYLPDTHPLKGRVYHCPKSCSIAVSGWTADRIIFSKGFSAKLGGWDDQPALYAQAMQALQSAENILASIRVNEVESELAN